MAEKGQVYKVYDDGYTVRAMTADDVHIVNDWWSVLLGIQPKYDCQVTFEMCLPDKGCFIGEFQGKVVASAMWVHWGGGQYFGSNYYVEENYRRRGFGTRIHNMALDHVGNSSVVIDSVLVEANNYERKFGYISSFKTQRLMATAKANYGVSYKGNLVKADDVPFQDLINFDNKHFILENSPKRRFFLDRWLHLPDGSTSVALSETGAIVGFGCRRPAVQAQKHFIGPLYAESVDVARAILGQLCQEVQGDNVIVNVWTTNTESVKMLEEFGFSTKLFDCMRMYKNHQPQYKPSVYLFTSMETCGF